jgi:Tol biopolymer transport system component
MNDYTTSSRANEANGAHAAGGRNLMQPPKPARIGTCLASAVLCGLAASLLGDAQAQPLQRGPSFGEWAPAASVDEGGINGINTAALEGCPMESPDGGQLYFASNREGGAGGIDIWVAHRNGRNDTWTEPEALPAPVNSMFDDFCPTPLTRGRLLFVSNRGSKCGSAADIYETRHHPVHGWLEPQNLGCQVNSGGNEFSPSLVERYGLSILFFSSDRNGSDDIYMSVLSTDGTWGPAQPVEELNSPFNDARPNVRADGLEIVFDRNTDGGPPDIWVAYRSSVFARWSAPEPLGSNVNSGAGETRASLSRDGRRLYFGSNRSGGEGHFDIYVSTRSPSSVR